MLLKLFRGTGPGVVFLIVLASALLWTSSFIEPHPAGYMLFDKTPMPLYSLLMGLFGKNALAGVLFSYVLVLLLSFLIVNFNTAVFFINERTFLPAIIYVLFTGFFPHYQVLNPVLPAAVLIMIALRRIMDAYRKNGTAYNFFDAALLISLASLFYANAIWFGVLSIVGIIILRTGNIGELILAILGLITPLLITAGLWYITGKDILQLGDLALYNLFENSGEYYFSRVTVTLLAVTTLCALISFYFLFSVMNSKKIKSRKTFTMLFWMFITAITVYFALPSVSMEMVYLLAIPLSYIIGHYFVFSRSKVLPEGLFTIMFIMVILIGVIYLM